ncbi:aldolase/citrate lyase family protein [Aureimonas altamirensis]|uniref:HpcH/HpaI aldolase/citrate lyase family protein n=1 Tax=Aureimonas altamirensis TaxID=370622 RepID=UPI002036F0F0|nr:aldolase/citrate lyase family protein [Aureimonas altamirensis]MCM2505563.1 aldolase/citrate lyase family protein [Aureimonas altamirensis]
MIRSLLYVPASSERFIGGAHKRGADAIILDLEDAVAPNAKADARDALVRSVPEVARGGAKVFVRINSEPELISLDAAAACRAGADGLVVPKTKSPETLAALEGLLAPIEEELARQPMPFIPLLEDPGAIFDARPIARGPRVLALAGGGEDLATAMDAEAAPDVLRLPKLLIHMAAKAERVLSFGLLRSVADYADAAAMRAAAEEARRFGFDGASCIHPAIVPILNAAFAPSQADIDWASRVVAASDAAADEGVGAFTLDGRFIDAPVVGRARSVLARAGRQDISAGTHPSGPSLSIQREQS